MAKNKVRITITGDATGVSKATGAASSAIGGLQSKVSSSAGKIAAGFAAMFAVDKVTSFAGSMLTLGTSLDVMAKKSETVFGSSVGAVRAWADANNEAFGVTDEQLVGMAANFGDLLKPMGFTADQAAAMSQDVIGLSGALSAWSGGQVSSAQATEILSSAMLGEREGLKALGISIQQADIDARLAAKGQSELTGAALQQAEAVATQELIFEKSTDAQKAWTDGSMDSVKQQNELKSVIASVKEGLAAGLFPILMRGVSFITDRVVPGVREMIAVFDKDGLAGVIDKVKVALSKALPKIQAALGKWAEEFADWAKEAVPPMLRKLGDLVGQLGNWVLDVGLPLLVDKLIEWGNAFVKWVTPLIPPLLREVGKLLARLTGWILTTAVPKLTAQAVRLGRALLSWLADLVPVALRGLGQMLGEIGSWIVNTAVPAIIAKAAGMGDAIIGWVHTAVAALPGLLGQLWRAIGDWLASMKTAVGNVAGSIWGGFKSAAVNAFNALIGAWNKLDFAVGPYTIPSWIPGVGGNTFSIPDIFPDLTPIPAANGFDGVVSKPTMFLTGEGSGPEHVKVTPLGAGGSMSRSGGSQLVQFNLHIDKQKFAEIIVDLARTRERSMAGAI